MVKSIRRNRPVLATLILGSIVCILPEVHAQDNKETGTRYGNITITEEWAPRSSTGSSSSFAHHGYVEYRFSVRNDSKKQAHSVTLIAPSNASGQDSLLQVSKTVEVPANSKAYISILQPNISFSAMDLSEVHFRVRMNGKNQQNTLMVKNAGRSRPATSNSYYGDEKKMDMGMHEGFEGVRNMRSFRIVAPKNFQQQHARAVNARGFGRPMSSSQFIKANEGTNWPTNWLAYSCVDSLVLAGDQIDKAPSEMRNSIWKYVEAGGSLVVLGKCKLPKAWQSVSVTNDLNRYHGGFGDCLVFTNAEFLGFNNPDLKLDLDDLELRELHDSWDQSSRPWTNNNYERAMAGEFDIVERKGLPVVSMLLLLILFSLLIGPVNLFILSKMRRRLWMLWNIPLFSLFACFSVFGYMVFYEGWQSYARAEAITILDENSQRATTLGWYGVYAPITPSDGLHFDRTTEVSPVDSLSEGSRYDYDYQPNRTKTELRTIFWGKDQHLKQGWVSARVPTFFRLRKTERRRERILVRDANARMVTVVNGLGAPIRKLWLVDDKGSVFASSKTISEGAEGNLIRTNMVHLKSTRDALRKLYSSNNWGQSVGKVSQNPGAYLRPGTYIAITDGTPFLENALQGSILQSSESVVFGIMKEPANGN